MNTERFLSKVVVETCRMHLAEQGLAPFSINAACRVAAVALLIGCGRAELAALTVEHMQPRDGCPVIVDLIGKGSRVVTVPMPTAAGVAAGKRLRPVSLSRRDEVAYDSMTPQSIFEVVEHYSQKLGIHVTPHDLRCTFATLANKGHAPLEQIQLSLGHASSRPPNASRSRTRLGRRPLRPPRTASVIPA